MRTILDPAIRGALIERIDHLSEKNTAQWGKMSLSQMIRHCIFWEEMALGKRRFKQALIGRIFGKIALKTVLRDEKPLRKNSPSIRDFIITDNNYDLEKEKKQWIKTIEEYGQLSNPGFIHPFFGKMTEEQIGWMAYKHIDHHLRQFNG